VPDRGAHAYFSRGEPENRGDTPRKTGDTHLFLPQRTGAHTRARQIGLSQRVRKQ